MNDLERVRNLEIRQFAFWESYIYIYIFRRIDIGNRAKRTSMVLNIILENSEKSTLESLSGYLCADASVSARLN